MLFPKPLHLRQALLALCLAPGALLAHDTNGVDEVVVTGLKERLYQNGMLKDVIQKTEVVSAQAVQSEQAENITAAIAKAPGVRVNAECSMCGVKRVMMNGLRGEHTTILVDGVPTHSVVSGFYGLDATSSAGIERIEIARGAGASLIAPEAIGGTINLITKQAQKNAVELDVAGGEVGYQKASVVGTLVANEDSTRLTLIASDDGRDQFDGDNNGVSEAPAMENQAVTARLSQDVSAADNLTLRASLAQSEVFGGPMNTGINTVKNDYFAQPEFASEVLFDQGDVRKRYSARPWETAEWIDTQRQELTGSWLHEASARANFTLTASAAQHRQDSFYEGLIYQAEDDVYYTDLRVNYLLTNAHHLTFGVNNRKETLRSDTNNRTADYVTDSFNYASSGVYVQDTWQAAKALEIAWALRADKLVADFIDPKKPGREIEKTQISPRVDARFIHTEELTSRLSFGQGYRVPLSFFETDHGLLDAGLGFNIAVEQPERSKSLNYSLNYEDARLSMTGSWAYTQVAHLAVLTHDENDVPTLSQLQQNVAVTAADLAVTYKLSAPLILSAVVEVFNYDNNFKQAYTVAPIEQRFTLSGDFEWGAFDSVISLVWIGGRDLHDYATPLVPTFDSAGTQAKNTRAPSYTTVDVQTVYSINEEFKLYLGATNLLGYSQVQDQQTPLYYEDGAFDVTHISGPLRGREAYLGVRYSF